MMRNLASDTTATLPASLRWVVDYKLYHLFFWGFYHFMWWSLAAGSPLEAVRSILELPHFVKYLSYVVFQALGVYFNLYVLMPRLLERGKLVTYLLALAALIFVVAGCIMAGYYLGAVCEGGTVSEVYHFDRNKLHLIYFQSPFSSTLAAMTLAMSIKLTKNWVQSKQHQQRLEKEKLETELKFLRAQFNPHFLFNTINSIFFLIHKNPDKASNSLAKFSDLLRYQLYECNEALIPLRKEIFYIENFIALEKLRLDDQVQVNYSLDSQATDHLLIAPFILMTFIENAFKHLSSEDETTNWIDIRLQLNGTHLTLHVANSVSCDRKREVVAYGGIGLPNIERRLTLLYPDQHRLDIRPHRDRFEVTLHLTLTETAASYKSVAIENWVEG
ncbi:Histidine kinase [Catalinimonas alkaloidigena]|uniref:Histidine kinase n=1 Tax=Catalinimonas alkaloidigena TaxID=1075417 RepID=A0A1G9KP11_9BACT|nr:histidine kinase [Catalinimonas alkaloidigena]SDL51580.1 Histidine kinase [Catalinimonas alkaloidigena]